MIIRQDFHHLPPKMFLMQIADALTKTYMYLWDRKDCKNRIKMTWKDLSIHYHKNSLRTNLRKLNNVGLLSYQEDHLGIVIELVGWSEIDD